MVLLLSLSYIWNTQCSLSAGDEVAGDRETLMYIEASFINITLVRNKGKGAKLPNSRFNQNLEGTIFAWLFVR